MVFEKLFGTRAKDVVSPPSLSEDGKSFSPESGAEKLDVKAKAEIDRQFQQIDTQLNKDTFWTKIHKIGGYIGMGAVGVWGAVAAGAAISAGLPLLAGGAAAWAGVVELSMLAGQRNLDRRLRDTTAVSFYRKESILRRFLKKVF